jgi:hypothetical protein
VLGAQDETTGVVDGAAASQEKVQRRWEEKRDESTPDGRGDAEGFFELSVVDDFVASVRQPAGRGRMHKRVKV